MIYSSSTSSLDYLLALTTFLPDPSTYIVLDLLLPLLLFLTFLLEDLMPLNV